MHRQFLDVNILPCDHEVMGLSLENNLLTEKYCVHQTQNGRTIFRSLCKHELSESSCPFVLFSYVQTPEL
jgi:hypothetical protein